SRSGRANSAEQRRSGACGLAHAPCTLHSGSIDRTSDGRGGYMQRRFGARAATVTIMFAALVAAGVMAACHNGPSNDHDTNGVNTGGASGQVMPSAADTIHHAPA